MRDVEERRARLIDYVWASGLPTGSTLLQRDNGITTADYEFGVKPNLATIDRLVVGMDYGLQSAAYLYHPIESNGCLFIYHSGHDRYFVGEDQVNNGEGPVGPWQFKYGLVIPALIRCGFTVLALTMPVYGGYFQPTVTVNGADVQLTTHDQMIQLLERPFRFFFEPITVLLNLLSQFRCVSMMGLSGGGWTTTLYAAMDPRIQRSYPVAGSVPIWLRPPLDELGDAEQVWPDLYTIANYTELYVMGAAGRGRRQFQFLNEKDPDCFAGTRHVKWVPQVKDAVASLGEGRYDFWLDQTNVRHSVSKEVLQRILADHVEFIQEKRLVALAVG